jgi:hypothetical protein
MDAPSSLSVKCDRTAAKRASCVEESLWEFATPSSKMRWIYEEQRLVRAPGASGWEWSVACASCHLVAAYSELESGNRDSLSPTGAYLFEELCVLLYSVRVACDAFEAELRTTGMGLESGQDGGAWVRAF